MAERTPARTCAGTNKQGNPCKSTAVGESGFCRAHDESLPPEQRFGTPEQAGIAGASPKPHVPGVIEEMRRQVESRIDEVLAPYFEALTGAQLTTTHEGEVVVSDVADLAARIAAAERLLDRVYGRPKQATELSGTGGGPLVLAGASDDELRNVAAAIAAKRAAEAPAEP